MQDQDRRFLYLDILMVALAVLNLSWIAWDWLYELLPTSDWLDFYAPVHQNFFYYDLIFVSIFLLELLVRWAVAVREKTYPQWFIYPIMHWYDVLGCIPIGAFRLLRVLRVIAILMRLQKLGLIDMRAWRITHILLRYYNIVVEEISDRVVVRILGSAQEEIRHGGEFTQQVFETVIQPRQASIVAEITERLGRTLAIAHQENQREIQRRIQHVVHEAVENNREIRNIRRIPLLGKNISDQLDHAISDIVLGVIEESVNGLREREYDQLISNITHTAFDNFINTSSNQSSQVSEALIETLELLKAQIKTRRWLEAP